MLPPRRASLGAVAAVVLLLAATAPSLGVGPGGSPHTGGIRDVASGTPAPATRSVAPATPVAGANCALALARFQQLYGGLELPPGIPNATFDGCPIGANDASLSFLSDGAGSGSNVSFSVVLPPAGAAIAQSYAMLSLRLAVNGVPCSALGASALSVELVPPRSPYENGSVSNWTVRTPVFDLAPPAACDPSCSNDTALFQFDGAAWCEDELLAPAVVALPGNGFAPGSTLTISFVGSPTGTTGLGVFVNDSGDALADAARTFGPGSSAIARAFEPFASAAGPGPVLWTGSGAVSAAWTSCPLPGGSPTTCDSFDPAFDAGAGSIGLAGVTYGTTGGAITDSYGRVGTSSSTLGCVLAAPACEGLSSTPGGAVPAWWLTQSGASASFQFGNGPSAGPGTFGGAAGQDARWTAFLPLVVFPVNVSQGSGIHASERLIDLGGIVAATLEPEYCGPPVLASATLSTGSATAGTWSATFPAEAMQGTFPVGLSANQSDGTGIWVPSAGSFAVASGSGTCTQAAPSVPTVRSAAPTGGGVRVVWNDSSPAISSFNVSAADGNVSNSVVVLESAAGSWGSNLSIVLPLAENGSNATVAVTATGLSGATSAPGTNVTPTAVAPAFSFLPRVPTVPIVGPNQTLLVPVMLHGGLGPFNVSLDLGTGAPAIVLASSGGGTGITAPLATFAGTLLVSLSVTDALGDNGTTPPVAVPVWQTPLGIQQSASAGDGFVALSWGTPALPGGKADPGLKYLVYSTENSSDAWRIASAGDVAGTFDGVTVTVTPNHTTAFPVPDGAALFAQVVGWSGPGVGALPAGNATLVGRPAPFLLSPITTIGGGRAPFTANFTAFASGGSNDSLLGAVYSFPEFTSEPATITGGNGTYFLNASYTFLVPGTFVVSLHVTDSEFDIGVSSVTVYVAPGAPPTLSASVLNGPPYNGTVVEFQASATGGSGTYVYNWSFGDGTQASGANPSHAFALPGTYTVVVRVTDNSTQGVNVTTLPVTVFSDPVVFISAFPGADGSSSFTFDASVGGGSGASIVTWSFGDGSIGHGVNITHVFPGAGYYNVSATAQDPAGRSGTTSFEVYVAPASASAAGGGGGVSETTLWVLVAVAAAVALVVVLVARRPPPPTRAEPVNGFDEEDGAVTEA